MGGGTPGAMARHVGRSVRIPADIVPVPHVIHDAVRTFSKGAAGFVAVAAAETAFTTLDPTGLLSLSVVSNHFRVPTPFALNSGIPLSIGDGAETWFVNVLDTSLPIDLQSFPIPTASGGMTILTGGSLMMGGQGGDGGGPERPGGDSLSARMTHALKKRLDQPRAIAAINEKVTEWARSMSVESWDQAAFQENLKSHPARVLSLIVRDVLGNFPGTLFLLKAMGVFNRDALYDAISAKEAALPKALAIRETDERVNETIYSIWSSFESAYIDIHEQKPTPTIFQRLESQLQEWTLPFLEVASRIARFEYSFLVEQFGWPNPRDE